jgi:ArsR family transcriptional regulator, virulence genes transcriptional regulator
MKRSSKDLSRTSSHGAMDLATFERNAKNVEKILRTIANGRRLMILCKLAEWGEGNVSAIAEAIGLSQSAVSQHLARLRAEGLVTFKRQSQTLWYRIADPRIEKLFDMLYQLYCR